jgi:hypothetical protein
VFVSKRAGVTGEWRKVHNEELNDLYPLPNIVRVVTETNEMGGARRAYGGEERRVHRVLVGKSEGKSPLGRPRRRCDGNIKMDVQEVGDGGGFWM